MNGSTPPPDPSQVCVVGTCLPVQGGITEGGLIIIGILAFAIIAGAFVLLLFWRYGKRILAGVQAARKQVENDHGAPPPPGEQPKTANLREDLDEKHGDVISRLDRMSDVMVDVLTRVSRMERVGDKHGDRLDELEDTESRRRQPPPAPPARRLTLPGEPA